MSKQFLIEETKLFPEPVVYYNGYSPIENYFKANNNIALRIEELRRNKKIIAVIGRLEIDKRIDRAVMIIKSLVDHGKKCSPFNFR